jgi:hypothetical protein
VSSARKHVGDEDQDSGGSVNLAGDFRRRSLPCAGEISRSPANLAPSRRRTRRRSLAWPAPEKETGNRRGNRQDRDRRASLPRVGVPPPLAHSARRRCSLVGAEAEKSGRRRGDRGGGGEIGAEAGRSGRRRGNRGGGALECAQVRAGRVAPPLVGTLI